MELTAYTMEGYDVAIRPAPVERDWMEASKERFAYRCLPLNIANAHGWEMLLPTGFKAMWSGRPDPDAVRVISDSGEQAPALGHFGHGVLTFHVMCLFRTEPGYDLMVQGPINRPKDGIAPLTGIIETDWAPYTFTMNWMFTRPGHVVRFEAGEPFCHFFPVKRGEIEQFAPRIRAITDNPELMRQQKAWSESRNTFMKELQQAGTQANEERWQKLYYRGLDAEGQEVKTADHRTRVRLKPFAR
ncbi:MAG TPA: DUF6065 family protein [Rhizomicrobium sp.]|nr:DUF6065 family protein [Rhizomicrobium sp.]